MSRIGLVSFISLGALLAVSCGDDDSPATTQTTDGGAASSVESSDVSDAATDHATGHESSGNNVSSASMSDAGDTQTSIDSRSDAGDGSMSVNPTYYQHVLPLLETYCLGCHVEGGIAPMRLDDYQTARAQASAIVSATASRVMPPYLVRNDGSCGDFSNAPFMKDDELQILRDWLSGGTVEGTPRDIRLPSVSDLSDDVNIMTPHFVPTPGGGALDENDDYRCFLLDPPAVGKFITGYQVLPGNAAIVHHIVVNLVDLDGPSDYPTPDGGVATNRKVIDTLDAQDPDVEGWKCYGLAGDGVHVDQVPVVWAPGQGTVRYPNDAGIPVLPNHTVVVQVHYNLEDHSHIGESDQTKVRFEVEDPRDVPNVGIYLPIDPWLGSLLAGGEPDTLPPGKASAKYVWQASFEELGLGELPEVELWGVFPHMHETGHRFTVETLRDGAVNDAGASTTQCAAEVNQWDFHWQHLYFYEQAQKFSPKDSVRVTCDYDTRSKTEPILPGWGTQNEMCFLGMFVTVPNGAQ